MPRHSPAFWQLKKHVSQRRRDFLRNESGRDLIYPPVGTAWYPSRRIEARCDAFVVFFVAELETYWESVVNTALDSYQNRFQVSGLKDCASSEGFLSKIIETRKKFEKNNNANWSRISHYFIFVGLTERQFPDGLWDSIEAVVSQRGDIVHNSLGVRNQVDPRLTIAHAEKILLKLTIFDRDFMDWMNRANAEIERLKVSNTQFLAGLGAICI